MNCYICKKETNEFGNMYVEKVCLECTEKHIESHKKYNEFMNKYKVAHSACPKCGDLKYTTTLVSYFFDSNKSDEYKDLNRCVCANCGNNHVVHDRVPKSL